MELLLGSYMPHLHSRCCIFSLKSVVSSGSSWLLRHEHTIVNTLCLHEVHAKVWFQTHSPDCLAPNSINPDPLVLELLPHQEGEAPNPYSSLLQGSDCPVLHVWPPPSTTCVCVLPLIMPSPCDGDPPGLDLEGAAVTHIRMGENRDHCLFSSLKLYIPHRRPICRRWPIRSTMNLSSYQSPPTTTTKYFSKYWTNQEFCVVTIINHSNYNRVYLMMKS